MMISQSKISIFSDLKEPYAQYGLQHFLQKYGLSHADNPENADIFLGYAALESGGPRVQIVSKALAKEACCYLSVQGEIVPFFKTPVKTSGDHHLIMVVCGNEEYPCLSICGDKILVGLDIFAEIGRILAGCYDSYFLRVDEVGARLRSVPLVDMLEEALFSAISRIVPDRCSIPSPAWPNNHKFALVLTHDVDRLVKTYQYAPSLINSMKKFDVSGVGYHVNNMLFRHGKYNPYWTLETLTTLENTLGVKSTYYFLNERGRVNPLSWRSWLHHTGYYDIQSPLLGDYIKRIAEMDFEIGVHGSFDSYHSLELLKSEKQVLEAITGTEIIGVRQHYLNYDCRNTAMMQSQSGFKYDTSIGYKPDVGVGFRRGTSFPFRVIMPDLTLATIYEIPLIIMDGALDSAATAEDCLKLIDQVERYGGVLTILWHTQRFNQREYPGMTELYELIINKAKERGAWIATAREVYQWITRSV